MTSRYVTMRHKPKISRIIVDEDVGSAKKRKFEEETENDISDVETPERSNPPLDELVYNERVIFHRDDKIHIRQDRLRFYAYFASTKKQISHNIQFDFIGPPEHCGKGYGSVILKAIMKLLADNGCGRMNIKWMPVLLKKVPPPQARATKFFKDRHGFISGKELGIFDFLTIELKKE